MKTVDDASQIQITRVASNGSDTAIFKRSDTPPLHTNNDEAIKTAIENAWEKYCQAGYCGGYQGTIVDRTGDVVTVVINGNTRYLTYLVSGEPGNYSVQLRQTSDGGRIRP